MLIFIGGMPRSGSTFSFNVAREILAVRGRVFAKAGESIHALEEQATGADHVICKAHGAWETTIQAIVAGEVRSIATVRAPEDAVASWLEAFDPDLDKAIAFFRTWFTFYDRIKAHCLTVEYEQIETDPSAAALAIARYLVPDVSVEEVAGIVRRHEKAAVFERTRNLSADAEGVQVTPVSHFEKATLYHRRHVASIELRSADERMGAEAVARVRAELCKPQAPTAT